MNNADIIRAARDKFSMAAILDKGVVTEVEYLTEPLHINELEGISIDNSLCINILVDLEDIGIMGDLNEIADKAIVKDFSFMISDIEYTPIGVMGRNVIVQVSAFFEKF